MTWPTLGAAANDEVRPAIVGFERCSIRSVAERTAAQWRLVEARRRAGRTLASTAPVLAHTSPV